MDSWRRLSAWLLLVLLGAGGVLAPTLHRTQHPDARPWLVPIAETPLHAEGAHTYRPMEAAGLAHRFHCLPCQTHLVFKLLQQAAAPAPQLTADLVRGERAVVLSSPHLSRTLIRGPPVQA